MVVRRVLFLREGSAERRRACGRCVLWCAPAREFSREHVLVLGLSNYFEKRARKERGVLFVYWQAQERLLQVQRKHRVRVDGKSVTSVVLDATTVESSILLNGTRDSWSCSELSLPRHVERVESAPHAARAARKGARALLQPEAGGIVYGDGEPVAQLGTRAILRHREQVEAGVRRRQIH